MLYFSWFYGGISREEAMKHLLCPVNKDGAFLIRERENVDDKYELSVRVGDEVQNYRIKVLDNSKGLFMTKGGEFATLQDLVEHYYKNKADDVCFNLKLPCIKVSLIDF